MDLKLQSSSSTPWCSGEPTPTGFSALYVYSVTDGNLRFPLTSFFLSVMSFYTVGLSRIHPLCVLRIVSFEMLAKSLGQALDLNVFR